jgi:hypothetical protein
MAAPGEFHRVRNDVGWQGRIVNSKGETVWQTGSHPTQGHVDEAFDVFTATVFNLDTQPFTKHAVYRTPVPIQDVDERVPGHEPHAGDCPTYRHEHGLLCSFTCPTCHGTHV